MVLVTWLNTRSLAAVSWLIFKQPIFSDRFHIEN